MTAAPITYPCRAGTARLAALALAALALALYAAPGRAQDVTEEKAGQLTETKPALPVPALTITDMDEQPADLAAYRGKPLIVNLWATWCGPCIREMPSLAKLAAALKDQGLAVIAISEDRAGKFGVDPFLKEHGITGLPIYLDKTSSAMKGLKAKVMPTTILVDAQGNEIARVFGDREWDSPASRAEIAKLFGLKVAGN